MKNVLIGILFISFGLSIYFIWKNKDLALKNENGQKKELVFAAINQLVPFLALFVTIFATPETIVKILTPDYEDKIVENQK